MHSRVPPDPYLPPAGDEPRSEEDCERFERELDAQDRHRFAYTAYTAEDRANALAYEEWAETVDWDLHDWDKRPDETWEANYLRTAAANRPRAWLHPVWDQSDDGMLSVIEALRESQADEVERHLPQGWRPLRFLEIATTPVTPPDVAGLFYCGQRHVLSGEADLGKTWIMLWAAVEEIQAGHAVLWVNTDEAPPGELLERLLILGLTPEQVESSFLYLQPDLRSSADEIADLVTWAEERDVRLVVVDSFNSAMMVEGLDPLGTVDVETFWRNLATPLCRAGCAFVAIDHLPKSSENHGRYSYGSERKLSGASVHIGVRGRGFSREHGGGTVRLHNYKDRTGYLPKPYVGDFKLTVAGRTGSGELVPVDESEANRLTGYMEKVSRVLERVPEGLTARQIEDAVVGKSQHVRKALADLVEDGYVKQVREGKQSLIHTVLKPYAEDV